MGGFRKKSQQEWAEIGTIDGVPAKVYYIFILEEASGEEADSYPWDEDHVSKIELAEKDELRNPLIKIR